MKESIIIAVSDGFGGYGDFLFALKMADQLKYYYTHVLGGEFPTIHIVTQDSGKQKILNLKGDQEFGLEIITPKELEQKVKNGEINVSSVIEGPVFRSRFISEINQALSPLNKPIPLTMIPEYSYNSNLTRDMISREKEYRQKHLSNFECKNIIYTGFDEKFNEQGIILSPSLISQTSKEESAEKLDPKLKNYMLRGSTISDYQKDNELYFQYSHDTYPTTHNQTTARRFLEIHRQLVKSSDKNQDVLMVGKTEGTKKQALVDLKNKLIQDGFKKITFLNTDTGIEEKLHDSEEQGKTYRVIYSSGIPHESMISCTALSQDLMGATGDQSFGEALSANKVVVYECLQHKQQLTQGYRFMLAKQDPNLLYMVDLLSTASTKLEYRELGKLLTQQNIEKLKHANKALQATADLIGQVALSTVPDSSLHMFLGKNISPYSKELQKNLFVKTFAINREDLAIETIKMHHQSTEDQRGLCRSLAMTTPTGEEYLTILRSKYPGSEETKLASYLVTKFKLAQYRPRANSKREKMFDSFLDIVSTFKMLDTYDEKALIGLMLLATKDISNEYRIFSPEKGAWFGSSFYSNLKDALQSLDVNLNTITPEQRQEYYTNLAKLMEENPQFLANEYLLKTLSREAHIELPKVLPLLTESQARKIITSDRQPNEPTVIKTTSRSIYKQHAVPLAQGGWGKIYLAKHYSINQSNKVVVSQPLAMKEMPLMADSTLDKEMRLFSQAHPGQHFERFNKNGKAYLAMPLFPGLPLDKYLDEHHDLSHKDRTLITMSLLKNLMITHANGVIHNDLKPKNMLYDPFNNEVHIIDFGCAENLDTRIKFENINTAKFALEYMPPEYISGCTTSQTIDMYSMSLTLGEILGVDKFSLVQERLNRSLESLGPTQLGKVIQRNFSKFGSLDEALFSREVSQFHNTKEFKKFITCYTNQQYDFSPYIEKLGVETVEILNKIQNNEPSKRASFQEVLSYFEQQVKHDLLSQQHKIPEKPLLIFHEMSQSNKERSREEVYSLS